MFIKLLKAKIHRATITSADVDYVGSIAVDSDLLSEAGISAWESVLVGDVTNGARFETYVQPAEAGSGTICINGAAARLVKEGDLVIIFSFGYYDEADVKDHQATIVFVDETNHVTRVIGKR